MKFWTALVYFCLSPFAAYAAGNSSGGGGDALRFAVEDARGMAVKLIQHAVAHHVGNLDVADLDAGKSWLLEHSGALIADVVVSPYTWVEDERSTCAHTDFVHAAPIVFSFPTCRPELTDSHVIAELLIHESVHHLGISDESLADDVAIAAGKSWFQGQYSCTLAALQEQVASTRTLTVEAPGPVSSLNLTAGSYTAVVSIGPAWNQIMISAGGTNLAAFRFPLPEGMDFLPSLDVSYQDLCEIHCELAAP